MEHNEEPSGDDHNETSKPENVDTVINVDDEGCDEDCSSTCSICMEEWTIGTEHAVCATKCGHLFGRSCIERWIKDQGTNAKCPNCNKPAKRYDLRNIWCKTIKATDSTELNETKKQLELECKLRKQENGQMYVMRLKLDLAEQTIEKLKSELASEASRRHHYKSVLENIVKSGNTATNINEDTNIDDLLKENDYNQVKPVEIKGTFHRKQRVTCVVDGKCTSIAISSASLLAVVAQSTPTRSRNPFGDFGLRKYSIADTRATEFIPLHLRDISSFDLKKNSDLALTSSEDKRIKITSLTNNTCVLHYESQIIPSSVSWSKVREHQFFVGYSNCSVGLFDMRKTSESIYQTRRWASTKLISGASVGREDSEFSGFIMNDIKGCHFLEISDASAYEDCMIDLSVEHAYYHALPFVGKMGTVDYDEKSGHALISTRVNQESTNCVHNLVKLIKEDEEDISRVKAISVCSFIGGRSSSLLTQSKILRHPTRNSAVLVASHDEESCAIKLWDSSDNLTFQTIKTTETVRDMAMLSPENETSHLLFTLSDKSMNLFRWDFA